MSDIKAELARGWLIKARRDLLSAHQLAQGTVPLLDTAAYHCQQTAEKAIKGFLVYHDVRFEKTHDLDVLISQSSGVTEDFLQYRQTGRILTPLAVVFRYPGEYLEPEADEFQEAYCAAQEIFTFVIRLLPADLTKDV